MFSKIYEDIYMYEYESGTFRCTRCAKEFLTKDEAKKHYKLTHLEEETHLLNSIQLHNSNTMQNDF
jgi:hypothetical protein